MNFAVYENGGSVYNSLDELSRVAESFRGKESYYKLDFFMTKDFNWKNFTAVFPELPENVYVNINSKITPFSSFDPSIVLNAMCFSGGNYFIMGLIRTYRIFLTKEAQVQIHDIDCLSCIPAVICSGNSRLELSDGLEQYYIKLYDNSYLYSSEKGIINAYDKSTVKAKDSTISVYNKARIEAANSSIHVFSNAATLKTYSCFINIHDVDMNLNICDNASTIQIESRQSLKGLLKNSRIICVDGYLTNDYNGAYFDPRKYINSNGIYYKCVKKRNGRYYSFFNNTYEYKIGEFAVPDSYDSNLRFNCTHGIHVATIEWALEHYFDSKDCAILEVKVPDDAEIIAPYTSDGKLRASKAEIIREVSLDEFGELGEFYKKFARIED